MTDGLVDCDIDIIVLDCAEDVINAGESITSGSVNGNAVTLDADDANDGSAALFSDTAVNMFDGVIVDIGTRSVVLADDDCACVGDVTAVGIGVDGIVAVRVVLVVVDIVLRTSHSVFLITSFSIRGFGCSGSSGSCARAWNRHRQRTITRTLHDRLFIHTGTAQSALHIHQYLESLCVCT
jgi:hypothetical protein